MDHASPWMLATLLFLVLLGSGRTLRGRWLVQPPFGTGIVLSTALGVAFYSLLWMGLGHFGLVQTPWPLLILVLGLLLAVVGLFGTWGDWRAPASGLERGFGPRWFAIPAWLVIVAALLVSLLWISGAFDWDGRNLLFERAAYDYELGRVAFDPVLGRDPFLADEPLALWLYGLGTPGASLALSWWLGVALLFGVCGIGWRLHAHGAGLAAAALLALVLFASDRPLLLAPALPATVALLGVIALAVESRGRPHLGRSLVAGGLGGYALISDPGAGAMLAPLLLFGPSWCKKAKAPARDERNGFDDVGDPGLGLKKKWATPLRHTGFGLVGLALPLLPWLGRNDAWSEEAFYAFREPYAFRLQADYRYLDYEPDFGADLLDDVDFFDGYLCATEWGLGLVLLALLSPWYGWRRREPALYVVPGLIGYGIGTAFGDQEITGPATLALLSVGAGSTLYTWRGCSPSGRTFALGGTLAAGGLSLGLSSSYDCGYWDDFDDYEDWPVIQYPYAEPREERESDLEFESGYGLGPRFRYRTPKLELQYRYAPDPGVDDTDDPPDWNVGPGYRLEPQLELDYGEPEEDAPVAPGVPDQEEEPVEPGYPVPRPTPRVPGHRPDVRPDTNVRPQTNPGYPSPGYRTTPR